MKDRVPRERSRKVNLSMKHCGNRKFASLGSSQVRKHVPERDDLDPLARLKEHLLQDLLSRTSNRELRNRYRWAAEDAAALAFVTPFPELFFPALLGEKVALARGWVRHQESIRNRCSPGELSP